MEMPYEIELEIEENECEIDCEIEQTIDFGGVKLVVDEELSEDSINPVQNKVITEELNKKQEILVSGENIKTINGQDILGEGDIEIKGTKILVDGKAVETFDADTKQDKLEDGLNIKTINGESILGEGNIDIVGTGGGTTVTVDGEAVSTFDADTKLDKEKPTFASNNYGCYVYGVVTPNATSHKPTTVDGMIPSDYLNTPRTIVQRDNQGCIRGQKGLTQGIWNSTDGSDFVINGVDLVNLAISSIPLTGESGILQQAQFYCLRQSAVLTIILDNELYHKVINDATSGIMTYQHISGSTIKTITVNTSARTWELTTQDILGDLNSVLDAILGV